MSPWECSIWEFLKGGGPKRSLGIVRDLWGPAGDSRINAKMSISRNDPCRIPNKDLHIALVSTALRNGFTDHDLGIRLGDVIAFIAASALALTLYVLRWRRFQAYTAFCFGLRVQGWGLGSEHFGAQLFDAVRGLCVFVGSEIQRGLAWRLGFRV